MKREPISNLVSKVGQGDPAMLGKPWIKYLDIASVDNETKRLVAPHRIATDSAPSRARQFVRANDVLVSTVRPNLNAVAIIPPAYCGEVASTGFCVLRSQPTQLCPAYLFFFTQSAEFVRHLTVVATGASYPAVTDADILGTLIPLPTLSEQQRIAGQLEQADRLRRTRRYALELSDTFLPAVFLQVFGDPFSPRADSLSRLEDILEAEPQNGLYVPSDRYVAHDDPTGTEMVHMSDLFGGIAAPGNLKRVRLEAAVVAKYQLSDCDILIARRSLAYEGAAQPCRIPALKGALVFESSMIRIRPDCGRVLPVYLYYYLTNPAVREHRVRRYVTISTISGINQDNLCRIEVMVPPLPLQRKFAALVARHERLRAVQREALRQADHLFRSLLHQAFAEGG